MFNALDMDVRYHALQMALGMEYLNAEGRIERLSLAEVLNAAAAFELFIANGESVVPHLTEAGK